MKIYVINPMYTSLLLMIIFSAYVSSLSTFYMRNGRTFINMKYEVIFGGPRNVITKLDGLSLAGVKRIRNLTPSEILYFKNLLIKERKVEKKQEEEERKRKRIEEDEERQREQEEEEREKREEEEEGERREKKEEREREMKQEEEEREREMKPEEEERKREMRQEREEREREREEYERERKRERDEYETERKKEQQERQIKQNLHKTLKIKEQPKRVAKKTQRDSEAAQCITKRLKSNTGQQIIISNAQNTPPKRLVRRNNLNARRKLNNMNIINV